MIDTITAWINALVLWLDTLPPGVLPILAGIAIGSLSTQWLKRTFPATIVFGVSEATAVMMLRIAAFFFSALPTYFMWPVDLPHAAWAALFVGFATPTIYRACTFILYKKFPQLEARLSGTAGTGEGK